MSAGFYDEDLLLEEETTIVRNFETKELKYCIYHERLEPKHRFSCNMEYPDLLMPYCLEAEEVLS